MATALKLGLSRHPRAGAASRTATRPSSRATAKGAAAASAGERPGRAQALAGRDFIDLADLTPAEFAGLLDLGDDMRRRPERYRRALAGRGLAMIFEKPSLRTRVTFDVAMQSMGGYAIFLDFTDSPLGEREDIVDVARNLELWLHGIVARTFEHDSIRQLAEAARIPVVNGLSNWSHPCQALADFLALRELHPGFASPTRPRRKLKLAYVGDGNNTLHSLLEAAALAGLEMSVATPAGYEPEAAVMARARAIAAATGARLEAGNSLAAALRGANAVYTDTWASMGQEAEATRRARDFAGFQVTPALMAMAAPGAHFMHCLPAHRGQEVAAEVMDSPAAIVYRQAANRLHAQKAVLAALLGGAAG